MLPCKDLSVLALVLAAVYQISLKPKLEVRKGKAVTPLNNVGCTKIHELKGCEDQFIDTLSGISYLACTDPELRTTWLPPIVRSLPRMNLPRFT